MKRTVVFPCGCTYTSAFYGLQIFAVNLCPQHTEEPELKAMLILLVGKLGLLNNYEIRAT